MKRTSYRCRAAGDGLTILSTSTIEEARQVLEEEPLIKRGLRTFELRKLELRGGPDRYLPAHVGQPVFALMPVLLRRSDRAQQVQVVPMAASRSRHQIRYRCTVKVFSGWVLSTAVPVI